MSRSRRGYSSHGFTLIELMIVTALVAIVIAMAIPNLLSARISGNESSAVSSLRTIATVSGQYRTRFGQYPGTLNDMLLAGYIDDVLGSGTKSGYDFSYQNLIFSWEAQAVPVTPGGSGERHFFVDESGVIRFESSAAASAASPPID